MVGGVPSPPRRLSNHTIAGPDHSVVHPGIFPHNPAAAKLATIREWLSFDHKAGWGTDAFEDNLPADAVFPDRWVSADDRYDAREILNRQFALLADAAQQRPKGEAGGFGDGRGRSSGRELGISPIEIVVTIVGSNESTVHP